MCLLLLWLALILEQIIIYLFVYYCRLKFDVNVRIT